MALGMDTHKHTDIRKKVISGNQGHIWFKQKAIFCLNIILDQNQNVWMVITLGRKMSDVRPLFQALNYGMVIHC